MRDRQNMRRRIAQLLIGLFLCGFAVAMMVTAGVGVAPWDVLAQGVSKQTGIAFGLVTVLIGVLVLVLWVPIRQKPGVGTVLNALMIGPSAQLGLWLLPATDSWWGQVLMFAGGLVLFGFGSGLYIGARLGPGPRDGLMTGIHHRTGWRIWIVRTGIETVALTIGWLLGGNVGLGTLAFALLIGPLVSVSIPLLMVPAAISPATGDYSR